MSEENKNIELKKTASVRKAAPNPNEVATIDTIRRVSEIRLPKNSTNEERANEHIYIDAIRRVSGMNVADMSMNKGKDGEEYVTIANRANLDKITTDRKMTSSEIGVIEAVRRLSGVNAALNELGEVTVPRKMTSRVKIDVKDVHKMDLEKGGYAKIKGLPEEEAKKEGGKGKEVEMKDFGLGDKEWHLMSEEEIFAELKTSIKGLNTAEHEERLLQYGPNAITPPPVTPFWLKAAIALVGGFQVMLWVGSILCFIVYGITGGTDLQTLILAIVLILVIVVTTSFQLYQEGKSDKVMAALKALAPSVTFVYRNGELQQVAAESLVPGDVVKVQGGDKVPADIRILSSSDLKVNNASLTGKVSVSSLVTSFHLSLSLSFSLLIPSVYIYISYR
jgi:magnesium-transporting ATPase (P-type)